MLTKREGKFVCIEYDCKKTYSPNVTIRADEIKQCFEFAVSMAEGEKHNTDSFASQNPRFTRETGSVFRDAFQGKIAEIAFYNYYSHKFTLNPPDFDEWERGKWEDTDFIISDSKHNKNYSISIKSTKSFGNLLMLEKNRYNNHGEYLEGTNGKSVIHDLIFLIRIKGIDSIYPDTYYKKKFTGISAEITGYITHKDFVDAITNKQFIEAGTYINGCEELKVDNYYFCASKLKLKDNDK